MWILTFVSQRLVPLKYVVIGSPFCVVILDSHHTLTMTCSSTGWRRTWVVSILVVTSFSYCRSESRIWEWFLLSTPVSLWAWLWTSCFLASLWPLVLSLHPAKVNNCDFFRLHWRSMLFFSFIRTRLELAFVLWFYCWHLREQISNLDVMLLQNFSLIVAGRFVTHSDLISSYSKPCVLLCHLTFHSCSVWDHTRT